jgi:hypothetical protein
VYVFLIVLLLTRRRGETRMVKPSRIVSRASFVPRAGNFVSRTGAADQRGHSSIAPVPVHSAARVALAFAPEQCAWEGVPS